MYDWANSAFQCTIITAVFPVYFSRTVAAAGLRRSTATARFAWPPRSAGRHGARLADARRLRGLRRRQEALLAGLHGSRASLPRARISSATRANGGFALAAVRPGEHRRLRSFVFYDSLLPHIAPTEEMDRVSGAAMRSATSGGGVLLALNLPGS